MYIYLQDNAYDIIQQDVENNFHKFINKTPQEIKIICIVGAYHGTEIHRLLSNYPNALIHAFEAHPKHYSVLKDSFKDNSRVILYNKAVSNINGTINFYELSFEGSGSILAFQGEKLGAPCKISETIQVESVILKGYFKNTIIDLLWIDVQGAELKVLQGTDIKLCSSMFLEIHTHDFIEPWDKECYKGQCYKEDLEKYLTTHYIHSIGLDNKYKNGQGNSFWLKNK